MLNKLLSNLGMHGGSIWTSEHATYKEIEPHDLTLRLVLLIMLLPPLQLILLALLILVLFYSGCRCA